MAEHPSPVVPMPTDGPPSAINEDGRVRSTPGGATGKEGRREKRAGGTDGRRDVGGGRTMKVDIDIDIDIDIKPRCRATHLPIFRQPGKR